MYFPKLVTTNSTIFFLPFTQTFIYFLQLFELETNLQFAKAVNVVFAGERFAWGGQEGMIVRLRQELGDSGNTEITQR